MTEPVAYWHVPKFESDEPFVSFDRSNGHSFEDTPLYTAEQLHPRVKMTQEQKDYLTSYKNQQGMFMKFIQDSKDSVFNSEKDLTQPFSEEQLMVAWLNPEEVIKVKPEKRWMLRTKTKVPDIDGERTTYLYLAKGSTCMKDEYTEEISLAIKFDTEEEAIETSNILLKPINQFYGKE